MTARRASGRGQHPEGAGFPQIACTGPVPGSRGNLATAGLRLAVMPQTGKGQAPDPSQAEIWLRRATAQGHGAAKAALQEAAPK